MWPRRINRNACSSRPPRTDCTVKDSRFRHQASFIAKGFVANIHSRLLAQESLAQVYGRALRIITRCLPQGYKPLVIGCLLFVASSGVPHADIDKHRPVVVEAMTGKAGIANPSPLLEAATQLGCAPSEDHANQLIDRISHQGIELYGLPDEWLGTEESPALYAATFDFLVHELLNTVTRYPTLKNPVEQLLLSWNYCHIQDDDNYFNLTTEKNRNAIARTIAAPNSITGWMGMNRLGFDIPATYGINSQTAIPRYVPGALTTQSQTRLFRGKRFWELYTAQCFPHPDNGTLYHRKKSFGPTRLKGIESNLSRVDVYPFQSVATCSATPVTTAEQVPAHQVNATQFDVQRSSVALTNTDSSGTTPSLPESVPNNAATPAQSNLQLNPDTKPQPASSAAVPTEDAIANTNEPLQNNLSSNLEAKGTSAASEKNSPIGELQGTSAKKDFIAENSLFKDNARLDSATTEILSAHENSGTSNFTEKPVLRTNTGSDSSFTNDAYTTNEQEKPIQSILNPQTSDINLKARINSLKTEQRLFERGKNKRINKIKQRYVQLSRKHNVQPSFLEPSIVGKVLELIQLEKLQKKRMQPAQRQRVVESRRFAEIAKRNIATVEADINDTTQRDIANNPKQSTARVPLIDKNEPVLASATIVLDAKPQSQKKFFSKNPTETTTERLVTTISDTEYRTKQRKKQMNALKAARVRASRNTLNSGKPTREQNLKQIASQLLTSQSAVERLVTFSINKTPASGTYIDVYDSFIGPQPSRLAVFAHKKQDSIPIQRAKRINTIKSTRVQRSRQHTTISTESVQHPVAATVQPPSDSNQSLGQSAVLSAQTGQIETAEPDPNVVAHTELSEEQTITSNTSDAKRTDALKRLLAYIDKNAPIPSGATIVLRPDAPNNDSGFNPLIDQHPQDLGSERHRFTRLRGESIRRIIDHREENGPASDTALLTLSAFGIAHLSYPIKHTIDTDKPDRPGQFTDHHPTARGLLRILSYLQKDHLLNDNLKNRTQTHSSIALSLTPEGVDGNARNSVESRLQQPVEIAHTLTATLNKYRNLLEYVDQRPEMLNGKTLSLGSNGATRLSVSSHQLDAESLRDATLTQLATNTKIKTHDRLARTEISGTHLVSRARMWHVLASRQRASVSDSPSWQTAFAYWISADISPAARAAKRRHAFRIFGEAQYANFALAGVDTNQATVTNGGKLIASQTQPGLPAVTSIRPDNSNADNSFSEAAPTVAAAVDTPIYVTTPSSNANGLSPVANVPPHLPDADDDHSHGFSGTIALNNTQQEFGNEDHYSLTSSVAWKPVKDSFFFLRSAVTINNSDDPVNYTWGLGYDDWRPGSWGFEINNWNPLSPSDGLDLENAVVSLTRKFKHQFLDEKNLNSSLSLNKSANSELALTWLISWAPRPNWFIRSLITQPLEGGPTSWAYGFGYNNWRKNTFSLEYNNWGFNETFDTNFRQNAVVTLSYKWEW